MQTKQEVIVIVDAEGNVTIEAVGFSGPSCLKATEALEQALGTVTSRKKKPEWYQNENVSVGQKVGG